MTIVEAFSCGLPVAASGHGSLAEIIVPGRNGDHFVPGDAVSLAAVVSGLLGHPSALAAMAARARADFVTLYSAQRNLPMLEAIYAQAIESAAVRQATPAG
jgi:glycosyltransferase involved in cell wall biosynthesis